MRNQHHRPCSTPNPKRTNTRPPRAPSPATTPRNSHTTRRTPRTMQITTVNPDLPRVLLKTTKGPNLAREDRFRG